MNSTKYCQILCFVNQLNIFKKKICFRKTKFRFLYIDFFKGLYSCFSVLTSFVNKLCPCVLIHFIENIIFYPLKFYYNFTMFYLPYKKISLFKQIIAIQNLLYIVFCS
ncbi:hypothetical protein EDEG_01318 [Edhazardia aedis USNM 41457]|uniref:Transmembrane protein n=1 Tax=Edhazardia aedis (strain USNM 41457) TaxID=1003232 RepID=J8ZXM9_EDHAE|nr:hypothetical protein EDEG_01318 [Edhazardia aedis USNM 41457]|eukprot:EJW04448.1 hypothetical protein EDEG_01318 [Edhazardia aedis USNM 41457]